MGRFGRLRNVGFVSLLALAAILLVLARGADEAKAAPFTPSTNTLLAGAKSAPAGAATNVSTSLSWGNAFNPSRQFPGSFASFSPGSWTMYTSNPTDTTVAPTDAIPIGTVTGTATALTTLGLLNSACASNVPVAFPGSPASSALLDGSTDTSAA